MNKISLADIEKALTTIYAYPEEVLYEDDFKIIYGKCGRPTKIQLKKNVESGMSKDELKEFWLKKSKEYEMSRWSADFNDLGRN